MDRRLNLVQMLQDFEDRRFDSEKEANAVTYQPDW